MKEQESYWCNERCIRWKIMKEFARLREKTYSYLIGDGSKDKKAKGTKKCAIKKLNI